MAKEEIFNQLHPLLESIKVLRREISTRLDVNTADQNQILIRLYQQKAFKQALKNDTTKFDGRDHHCENPVLGDFFVSSPKFFSARVGEGYSHFFGPRAEDARLTKILR